MHDVPLRGAGSNRVGVPLLLLQRVVSSAAHVEPCRQRSGLGRRRGGTRLCQHVVRRAQRTGVRARPLSPGALRFE